MEQNSNCLTLGMKAPDFKAMSTFGPIELSQYKGSWLVFFSHPGILRPYAPRNSSHSLSRRKHSKT